ncbi:insulin-like growth factor-binding protein complex acid labile subunit [Anneissia japonica]|uniref:insulin-like growth factor-binding protein complex acid labile subunit n=1 Tax=Anneissia japonica TaxID=1529436 RepID=UPI00142569F8|nr:insulin-like growth factor-binding protein complex acid labile subunit [Anneissia japonica]
MNKLGNSSLILIIGLTVIVCADGCLDVICSFDDLTNTSDCSSKELTCFPEFENRTRIFVFDNNLLHRIPDNAFVNATKIRVSSMQHNHIDHLEKNAFAHANQLVEINLNGNYISDVSSSAFEGLTKLHLLILSNNHLSYLPALNELVSLETLLLDNNIFLLTPELHLPRLTTLSLRRNNIGHVIAESFEGVPLLANLDMRENQISAFIVEDASISFQKIRKIDVSHNKLTNFRFVTKSTMEILELSYNRLAGIDFMAGAVRSIILESNLIHDLHDVSVTTEDNNVDSSIGQTEILMENNQIEFITPSSFQNIAAPIDVLSISRNRIYFISPNSFVTLTHIERIYLNGNNLQEVKYGTFVMLHHLKVIDISDNFIQSLEIGAFAFLPDLTKVFIGGNHAPQWLRNFSMTFNHSNILNIVDISGNNIYDIPSDFFEVIGKSLTHLVLSDNQLDDLKTSYFLNAGIIEVVDVRGNNIETIDDDFFQKQIYLEEINLNGNPLLCDCRLKPYHTWLQQKSMEDLAICEGPPNITGIKVIDLSDSQLVCSLPSIQLNKTIVFRAEGLDVVLDCIAFGIPQPVVSWVLPNKTELTATTTLKYQLQSNNSLLISDIVLADQGRYSCVASNIVGTVKDTIQLYVTHPIKTVEELGRMAGLAIGIAVLVQTFFACLFIYYWTNRKVEPRKTNNKLLAKAYPIERIHLRSRKSTLTVDATADNGEIRDTNENDDLSTQQYEEIPSELLTDISTFENVDESVATNISEVSLKPSYNDPQEQIFTNPAFSQADDETNSEINLERNEIPIKSSKPDNKSKLAPKDEGSLGSPAYEKYFKEKGERRGVSSNPNHKSHKRSNQKKDKDINSESVGAMFNSYFQEEMFETYC